MPWEIVQRDGRFCVLKQTTGEVKKCYPKRRDALKYLRALYVNTESERESKAK
jgi:hypothetical protein